MSLFSQDFLAFPSPRIQEILMCEYVRIAMKTVLMDEIECIQTLFDPNKILYIGGNCNCYFNRQ